VDRQVIPSLPKSTLDNVHISVGPPAAQVPACWRSDDRQRCHSR
jgi:hypothetical protein